MGRAVSGDEPDEQAERVEIPLNAPDLLAVNALGQFADHPRIAALRSFITGWYVSYLSAESARGQPEAGPQERLSRSGDNLANVIQYLAEQHQDRLEQIFSVLRKRVPRVERVLADAMPDGRLLLQIKCRAAAERTQLLVTTHSPFFLNGLRPDEVRILWRDEQGYTHSERAADCRGVTEFTTEGALLGDIWMEGHLGVGDPLVNQGVPMVLPVVD